MVTNTVVAATIEGLALRLEHGVKLDSMLEYMRTGSPNSWALQNWEFVKSCHASPPTFALCSKDLRLALELARDPDESCPVTTAALAITEEWIANDSSPTRRM